MTEKPKSDLSVKNMTRLKTLGQPRDLLLNGASTSKPKKVFAPNINAVRNKGKALPTVASDGNRKNAKKQSKEFRKRDSDQARFVQSTGIFSEGTSEIKRDIGHSSRASDVRDGGGDASAGMEKPKIDTDAVWNIDANEEAKTIADLLCYDEVEIDQDQYQPIVLPLHKNHKNFFKTFQPQLAPEAKVKQEPSDLKEFNNDATSLNQCSLHTPDSFNDSNVTYSLLKLPDTMPGRGFDEEGGTIDYTLDQMQEGQIGKIIMRKSGKMEMVIGDMSYDLTAVDKAQFKEDLMVSEENATEHDSTLTNLGVINDRYIISPAWQKLLSQKPDT